MRGPIGLRDVPHLAQIIAMASSAPAGAFFRCFGEAGDTCYQRIKNGTNKKNYSGD
jgi:hypothetical protein